MVKLMYNKGFSLIETLIVLLISTFLSIVSLSAFRLYATPTTELFESTIIYNQFLSILNHDRYIIEEYGISFNEIGHVNEGNSIVLNQKEYVIQLVTGRFYEKGKYLD